MSMPLDDMLREGCAVLSSGSAAAAHRKTAGLTHADYVSAVIFSSVAGFAGTIAAEYSGASEAIDAALGNEFTRMSLVTMLSMAVAFACLAAVLVWWGPAITGWLSARFGGNDSRIAAATWVFLFSLASAVVTLIVLVADVAMGLVGLAAPVAAGYLALTTALVSIVAVVSIGAVLARTVCGISGTGASILFAVTWASGAVAVAVIGSAPIVVIFGGAGT